MNDDRSRDERPARTEPEGAPEPWYERWRSRLGLKARESVRDDLEEALTEIARDPDFSPQERAMLKNVIGFHRVRVDDVMVPRADIVAVPADSTLGELLEVFRTAGHSRLPVYGETLDDPKGMVHIRDFLDYVAARAESAPGEPAEKANGEAADEASEAAPSLGQVDLSIPLAAAKILRPVLYVPRSMPAVDLLVRMQATRTHMALVIDEYGGTDGLVSIEDLVEMVVGDIEDEHDTASASMIVQSDPSTYLADARTGLDEVTEALGVDLAAEAEADEIDTLGGFIVTLAGRVPSRGELIAGPDNLEFEVLDADPRRVKRVRIHRREAASPIAATVTNGAHPPASPGTPQPPSTGARAAAE
jgi:CBS domain containing-hemolysin-like protein